MTSGILHTEDGESSLRKYDVVAVHGWRGEEASWTYKRDNRSCMWLEDLLPKRTGVARIIRYVYSIDDWHGISTHNIQESALDLLNQVGKERSDPSRNLVFVGHDLGGVIIKQALTMAIKYDEHSSIAARTSLMIFFGTPHRAENLESWERIACGLLFQSPRNYDGQLSLSEIIRTSSQTLRDASLAFSALERVYSVFNIFEDRGLPSIVSEDSATFGLEQEQKNGREKSHDELCQFSDGEDQVFQQICQIINRSSCQDSSYVNCLKILSNLGGMPFQVSNPHLRLLVWLKNFGPYQSWLGNPSGILCVHGKSVSELRMLESQLARDPTSHGTPIISFLFDSEDDRQDSVFELFASLSFQLLCAAPALFDHVSLLWNLMTEKSSWRTDSLYIFLRTMASCPDHERVICLIGAIEQCKASEKPFLYDLLRWANERPSMLRVIVTSNDQLLDPVPSLNLSLGTETFEERSSDLEMVVERETWRLLREKPAFKSIPYELDETVQRVNGQLRLDMGSPTTSFASTLVLSLLRRLSNGSTKSDLKATLQKVPDTLRGVYLTFVGTIPSSRWSWARKVLSWIVWSVRPLKLPELAVAVTIGTDTHTLLGLEDKVSQDLWGEIKETFGDLITINRGEIRLLHESTRDFLLAPQNEFLRSPEVGLLWHDGDGIIAETCLNYLSLLTARRPAPSPLPPGASHLVDYAVQYWPEHYLRMKSSRDGLLSFFQNLRLMRTWSGLLWSNQNSMTRGPSDDPLSIAAEKGCENLVLILLERSQPGRESLTNALEAAVRSGNQAVVLHLVAFGATSHVASHLAASFGHQHLLPVLPKSLSVDVPLLHVACESGYVQTVQALINAGAEVNAPGSDGKTPLHIASQFGHVDIISELLNSGALPDTVDSKQSTPLHEGCTWQQPQAVERLLEEEVDVGKADGMSMTPVHIAAVTGRVDIVNMLLAQTSEARKQNLAVLIRQDRSGSTPLHLSALGVHKEVVRRLLELGATDGKAKAETAIQDNMGNVPLHLAAQKGNMGIVKLLLDADPDQISIANGRESTPLHLAVLGNHTEVVRTILGKLESGRKATDVLDNFDDSGNTPLHLAASSGSTEIVGLLLGAKATVSVTDRNYKTPLLISCEKRMFSVALLLLKAGADTNIRDSDGRSPLTAATLTGHFDLVKLLLDYRADPNLPDISGDTPLLIASRQGSVDIVRLLYVNGASPSWHNRIDLTPITSASNEEVLQELWKSFGETIPLSALSQFVQQAVIRGFVELVREWMPRMPPDQLSEAIDEDGTSFLHLAASNGHLDVVEFVVQQLDINGIRGEPTNKAGRTPLSLAAGNGHLSVVEFFTESGKADMCLPDHDGRTPLSYAAEDGRESIIEHFLKQSNLRGDLFKRDNNDRSALWYAADGGRTKSVELLLKHEDPNDPDKSGQTPLHRGAIKGDESVISALLESDKITDIDAKDDGLATPLFLASYHRNKLAAQTLLKHKADPEADGPDCWRPLHAAHDSPEILRLLIEDAKADVNSKTDEGSTVLHMAAGWGYKASTKVLISHGANPLLPDDEGNTPIHLALENKNSEIAILLLGAIKPEDLKEKPEDLVVLAVEKNLSTALESLLAKVPKSVATNPRLVQLAVEQDKFRIAKFLQSCGSAPDTRDEHGWTLDEVVAAFQPEERQDTDSHVHPENLPPSIWSLTDKSALLEYVGEDGTILKYPHLKDQTYYLPVLAARADHPIPASCKFYFEVTVVNPGDTAKIGIGFCHKASSLNSMPGWNDDAWGYHGDDGGMYHASGTMLCSNGRYGKDQVIGCLVDTVRGMASFTRDGEELENKFEGIKGRLFPMVGLHTLDAEISVNFGRDLKSKPFKYRKVKEEEAD